MCKCVTVQNFYFSHVKSVCFCLCSYLHFFQNNNFCGKLTLKAPITTAADDSLEYFFVVFLIKKMLDISCESSAYRVCTDLEKSGKISLVLENSWNSKKMQFVNELSWNFAKNLVDNNKKSFKMIGTVFKCSAQQKSREL